LKSSADFGGEPRAGLFKPSSDISTMLFPAAQREQRKASSERESHNDESAAFHVKQSNFKAFAALPSTCLLLN
jgi:hypothetical protein